MAEKLAEKEKKVKKMNTNVRFLSSDDLLGRSPLIGSEGESEVDELDKLEAEDLAKKKRKLRALEMDTYISGKEVELKKNQAAITAAAGTPTTALAIPPQQMALSPDLLEVLAKLPDDTRQKIVTSVMMMNMGQGKMDPAAMIWMWPMMGNVGKQNPEMSQTAMIDLASKLNEGLVSGFKMAKEMVPQPSATHDPVDVALKITDYLNRNSSSTMEERLVNVIKEIKPPESFFEQLLKDDKYQQFAQPFYST
ncbi:hypothetical protein MUP77_06600 [Candidatus Bathyarchaeota archaeon]|nr:hypothetical protein [Candidatus Bathyarchaeota archaeon]